MIVHHTHAVAFRIFFICKISKFIVVISTTINYQIFYDKVIDFSLYHKCIFNK